MQLSSDGPLYIVREHIIISNWQIFFSTNDPSISSLTLYHWANAILKQDNSLVRRFSALF